MNQTPEHRTANETRSGDTHVIGDDGVAVNVDQKAREETAAAASAEAAKAEKRAARPAPAAAAEDPAKAAD